MNNPKPSCESRAEDISLLAAGCLTVQEEHELHEHFALCDACQKRFEEMELVCGELRAAKPAIDAERYPFIIERSWQNTLPDRAAVWKARSVGVCVTMLTACAVLFIVLLNPPERRSVVKVPKRDLHVDVVENVRPTVTSEKFAPTPMPTLLALRRAAVESDESFDRLLSQSSAPMVSESFNTRTSYEEFLR